VLQRCLKGLLDMKDGFIEKLQVEAKNNGSNLQIDKVKIEEFY
jgi:hypothetical protein